MIMRGEESNRSLPRPAASELAHGRCRAALGAAKHGLLPLVRLLAPVCRGGLPDKIIGLTRKITAQKHRREQD